MKHPAYATAVHKLQVAPHDAGGRVQSPRCYRRSRGRRVRNVTSVVTLFGNTRTIDRGNLFSSRSISFHIPCTFCGVLSNHTHNSIRARVLAGVNKYCCSTGCALQSRPLGRDFCSRRFRDPSSGSCRERLAEPYNMAKLSLEDECTCRW